MTPDDTLTAHIDACLAEGDVEFTLAHDIAGWTATAGKVTASGDTAIGAAAALLTAIREKPKAKPAKG